MNKFQNQLENNKFPHCDSRKGINSYLACFKMLSDFYELPLKKEFILRIINDQISRNKNKLLQPSQIASICELIGLRSNVVQINLDNISNELSLPALGLLNNNRMYFQFNYPKINGNCLAKTEHLRK